MAHFVLIYEVRNECYFKKYIRMFLKIFYFFFRCWMFITCIFCRIRLQEGFHFASSNSGIINMVLETDMKVRIKLKGHYYCVHINYRYYNVIHQGSPSLKRPLTKILILEQLRFRREFIILMFIVVKNRMILYRYEIWNLMSKQVKINAVNNYKIDKQGNKDKNVNMEYFGKFSNY